MFKRIKFGTEEIIIVVNALTVEYVHSVHCFPNLEIHTHSPDGGAVVQRVRHLGLRSVGRGFKSCLRQRCVTTLGKLFTPMCLCHQAV